MKVPVLQATAVTCLQACLAQWRCDRFLESSYHMENCAEIREIWESKMSLEHSENSEEKTRLMVTTLPPQGPGRSVPQYSNM